MTVEVRRFGHDDLEVLVAFVARLNADPMHHVTELETTAAGVRQGLADLDTPMVQGVALAWEGESLVGVLGLEWDLELRRCWLMGPLVDGARWDPVADGLWDAAMARLPAGIERLSLACDVRNERCVAWGLGRGFARGVENTLLRMARPTEGETVFEATALQPGQRASFAELHDACFPGAYHSAGQLIALQGPRHRLSVVADGDAVVGYIFAQVAPEAGTGGIDFVGVRPEWRRRGVGRRLMGTALSWAFSMRSIEHVDLMVRGDNGAAVALYEGLGFETVRTVVGLDRPWGAPDVRGVVGRGEPPD